MSACTKTLKVRVRDKHAKLLRKMAASVNFVWNYINDLSYRSIKHRHKFLSEFDFHPYTQGASKEMGLHSQTLQCIAKEYVTRRIQFKKSKLSWRRTRGIRRSLGWIPINTGASKWRNGKVFHNGKYFGVWDSYGLEKYTFKTASFSEDATGRWYFNVVVEIKSPKSKGQQAIGIDLGCKDALTCSNGVKLKGRWYRNHEQKLAQAQRANNKMQTRAIHRKIKNKRLDQLHHASRKLVKKCGAIFVGNVSSLKLTQTKMAKSVLDAGWGIFKTMLEYKCAYAGVVFDVVDEYKTTQICSDCHAISGPKGIADLGIREWTCVGCGAYHDRDVNSSRNILAVGLGRLVGGIARSWDVGSPGMGAVV